MVAWMWGGASEDAGFGRGVGRKGAGVWLVDGVDWRWRLRLKKVEALASGAGICLSGDPACISVVVLGLALFIPSTRTFFADDIKRPGYRVGGFRSCLREKVGLCDITGKRIMIT